MILKETEQFLTGAKLAETWNNSGNFKYVPLTVIDFSTFRNQFLDLLDLGTVGPLLRHATWSKRVARFAMFSPDHARHNDIFHAEGSSFSYREVTENPFISYVLRNNFSDFIDTSAILKHIKMCRQAKGDAIRPKESILVTGNKYRLPFHVDGCETLLIAIRGSRNVHILSNFADLLIRFSTKLHCQSYIPAAYEPYADVTTHVLNEGEGIVIPPLIPHAVEVAGGKATLAYTAYV